MPRRISNLVTACRAIRQAVTIWSWLTGVYVRTAERLGRWTKSITQWWVALCHWFAGGATKPGSGSGGSRKRGSGRNPSGKSNRRGWITGFRKSRLAARISRIRPRLSSGSSSISAASAASPRCSSNSITIRRPAPRREADYWKLYADWSVKMSIKAASRNRLLFGRTMNWNLNSRPDSNRP
jgi:hypothetical protein